MHLVLLGTKQSKECMNMPELPEVEGVVRALTTDCDGKDNSISRGF